MARKTKQEAERTYHALLDAAAALFIRQGVAHTTLHQIAREAGMTRGAIYWHFANKDAVIQALWQRNADRLHQAFSEMLAQIAPPDPAGRFRGGVKAMLRSVVEEPEFGQVIRIVLHNVEFTDQQTELQRFLYRRKAILHDSMQQAFSVLATHRALRVDLPPVLLAQGLLSYLHGLIHSHLTPGQPRLDLARDGDVLLDLYLDSLLA